MSGGGRAFPLSTGPPTAPAVAFVSEAVLCDQLLHRFYCIYSSLKVHGISTLFSFVFQVGKLRYQDVKWFAQASPLVRWGRARLHTHDLAVFPWPPDGTSQATSVTFLLFVMVPSPLGPQAQKFELSLNSWFPYPWCHKSKVKSLLCPPIFSMFTAAVPIKPLSSWNFMPKWIYFPDYQINTL